MLIAGDAFVTTKAESVFSVMLQTKKVSGPPKYLTTDWSQARRSVKALVKLEAEIVATGHGKPMQGREVRRGLHQLADHFYEVAVPSTGRYIEYPAVSDAAGLVYVPENNINVRSLALKTLGFIALTAAAYVLVNQKIKKSRKNKDALAYEVW